MRINLERYGVPLANLGTVDVRWLPDRFGTGYGGHGYGGDRLWLVWLADCMSPPLYLVRADRWEDAYDIAQECLCETIEALDSLDSDAENWITWTESGRPVSADDDIQVREVTR